MEEQTDFEKFDAAMGSILKADPKIVKAAMDEEKRKREEERKAKARGGAKK